MFNFGFKRKKGGLPKQGLLVWLKSPNSEDLSWIEEEGWEEEEPWLGYALPVSCFAAVGIGPWFEDADTPIARRMSDILEDAGINQYHILAHITKGVAVYDPYTTPDATLAKAHRVFKETLDVRPTILYNGALSKEQIVAAGGTYTGGSVYVPDHDGVLRTPGVDRPAVEGLRLVDVYGPELVVNGDFSNGTTGWLTAGTGNGVLTVESGQAKLTLGVNGYSRSISPGIPTVVGKLYSSNVTVISRVATGLTGIVCGASNSTDATSLELSNNSVLTWTTSFTFTATATTTFIKIGTSSGWMASDYIVFDNISAKEVIPTYLDTTSDGTSLITSTLVETRTGNADFSAFTSGGSVKKHTPSNPLTAPMWLCQPARTNYALQSATPATHATGSIPIGTYCLWCEGGTSVTATAGTAVGTFGAATPGTPKTITITTAGTVVLTVAGVVTWVQLESGASPTSRIYTTTAALTRAGTVKSFPTLGKIRSNNIAFLLTCVPRATGQSSVYLFGCYTDASNYTAVIVDPTVITYRKRTSGVNTDATVSITHAKDVPLQVCRVGSSLAGMQIAARQYTGGAWSAWTDGTAVATTAGKANAIIGSTYQIGALNSLNQPSGNLSELISWIIPDGISSPLTLAKKEFGV